MGRKGWRSQRSRERPPPERWRAAALLGLAVGISATAWAQELTFTAKVDKTTVEFGEPITLTLTLSGDLSDVTLAPLQLPEGVVVVGRSQSTHFTLHDGVAERSMSFTYLLAPQRTGMVPLGPFTVRRRKSVYQTDPIEITVKKKSAPAPAPPAPSERYLLQRDLTPSGG